MIQWVKALVLLQLWRRLQLQLRLNPWPGNFYMSQVQWKKERKYLNKFVVTLTWSWEAETSECGCAHHRRTPSTSLGDRARPLTLDEHSGLRVGDATI